MSSESRPFLQVEGLAKRYPGAGEPVFEGVNFTVERGEFVCIIGHSGCGKTTILNVLAGLESASEGHVFMDGREVVGPSLDRGVVFQGHALLPWLSVRRNIAFAVRSRRPHASRAEIDAEVEKYVALVGLGHAIDKKPAQLSGGMKQRTVMVISTLLNPSLLIADEITSALDVSTQKAVAKALAGFREHGFVQSMIFVTHDISLTYQIADTIMVMYAGKLAEKASAKAIVNKPRHPYTQLLISSLPEVGVRYADKRLSGIPGSPPSLLDPPAGCRFRDRCPLASGRCAEEPPVTEVEPGHFVACWKG